MGEQHLGGRSSRMPKRGGLEWGAKPHVCMHVLGTARTDPRVMREATALAGAGYRVSVVDVERDGSRSHKEFIEGVELRHLVLPYKFVRTRFKPWFLVKAARMTLRGTVALLRVRADIYHAHDDVALPALYIAARLRH